MSEDTERQLISMCFKCKKELGRKPLPANYGKFGIPKYDKGNLISHGLCDSCREIYYGDKGRE